MQHFFSVCFWQDWLEQCQGLWHDYRRTAMHWEEVWHYTWPPKKQEIPKSQISENHESIGFHCILCIRAPFCWFYEDFGAWGCSKISHRSIWTELNYPERWMVDIPWHSQSQFWPRLSQSLSTLHTAMGECWECESHSLSLSAPCTHYLTPSQGL